MKSNRSPFTPQQEGWIILKFGATGKIQTVRRLYRKHYNLSPRSIPSFNSFKRVIQRFQNVHSDTPTSPKKRGRPPISAELVGKVRDFLKPYQDKKIQISTSEIAKALQLSKTTVWRILRKKLGWFPYKSRTVVPLSDAHKADRAAFCQWLLQQPPEFEERVIWSDEKWFVLRQKPNKQNERYWAPSNPDVEVECNEQGGLKVMCWAAVIDGRVLLHWFDSNTSVNGKTYLNMLENVMWTAVRHQATRRGYWFQQDGASVHTTVATRNWLSERFPNRVISRLTDRHWPARSPDLSPLDYWFWSVALAELSKNKITSLQELKQTVQDFADSLDAEDAKRAVRHLRDRAKVCVERRGGHVE